MYTWFYQPKKHFTYCYPQSIIQSGQYIHYESPPTIHQSSIKIQSDKKNQNQSKQKNQMEPRKQSVKSWKILKVQKEQIQDDQYQENLLNQIREYQKKKIKQNKTRNFYSTIFRIFLRKICLEKMKENQENQIKNIIQKFRLSITVNQVMKIIHKKNKMLKSYIKVKDIKKFFNQEGNEINVQKAQLSKILRILMEKYLKNDFFLHYTISKNIRQGNTDLYLQTSRKFTELFLQQ